MANKKIGFAWYLVKRLLDLLGANTLGERELPQCPLCTSRVLKKSAPTEKILSAINLPGMGLRGRESLLCLIRDHSALQIRPNNTLIHSSRRGLIPICRLSGRAGKYGRPLRNLLNFRLDLIRPESGFEF